MYLDMKSMFFTIYNPHTGALFSIMSTFSVLAALLGSTAYSLVYPFTLKHGLHPGTSYWLMAIIWTIPAPMLL